MNSRPALATWKDTISISMMNDHNVTFRLPSRRAAEAVLCVLGLPHLRAPECCPGCPFIVFICFPLVLPSFQDFAKHSGQGQIKGLSRLKELNLTTENLSPVR